ncbi:WecB/TagA/CpsF family glycosyltransferase [[Pseudomonas] boreopolis]|uniref:WecB/TagA/CpsF family glycosyltransferase n=1 Tax=Xanthomonas boreopolis TaxID=86183 RepID=UPI003D48B128
MSGDMPVARGRFEVGELVPLGGFPVLSTTQEAFAEDLFRAMERRQRRRICFANTNFVVKCQSLRGRMTGPSWRIVNDGIGMDLGALLIHGRRFAQNLNGTDLIPYLCKRSPRPLRFFLLGSGAGIAFEAADLLRGMGQDVVGTCDGYREFQAGEESLVDRINASDADVLLVAFGNPLQERWIVEHGAQLRTPLVFGVGALLDFLSGNAQRAPAWVRRVRGEWLFRLFNEPKRLIKRYSWDLLLFFAVCLRSGKRVSRKMQTKA